MRCFFLRLSTVLFGVNLKGPAKLAILLILMSKLLNITVKCSEWLYGLTSASLACGSVLLRAGAAIKAAIASATSIICCETAASASSDLLCVYLIDHLLSALNPVSPSVLWDSIVMVLSRMLIWKNRHSEHGLWLEARASFYSTCRLLVRHSCSTRC